MTPEHTPWSSKRASSSRSPKNIKGEACKLGRDWRLDGCGDVDGLTGERGDMVESND